MLGAMVRADRGRRPRIAQLMRATERDGRPTGRGCACGNMACSSPHVSRETCAGSGPCPGLGHAWRGFMDGLFARPPRSDLFCADDPTFEVPGAGGRRLGVGAKHGECPGQRRAVYGPAAFDPGRLCGAIESYRPKGRQTDNAKAASSASVGLVWPQPADGAALPNANRPKPRPP